MAGVTELSLIFPSIRNFGVIKGEIISFEAPLTLIVGYNGSGKTVCVGP